MMGNLIQQQFFQARRLAVRRDARAVRPRDHHGAARWCRRWVLNREKRLIGRWRVARDDARSGARRSCRRSSTASCTCRSSCSWCSRSTRPAGRQRWGGFSTQWYGELLRSPELIDSFKNTLVVALAVTAISTVLGTLLAIGLERTVRSTALDSALFLPAVVPDIVLAIGLLSFFTLRQGLARSAHDHRRARRVRHDLRGRDRADTPRATSIARSRRRRRTWVRRRSRRSSA